MPSDVMRDALLERIAATARLLVESGPAQLPVDRANVDTRAKMPVPIHQATGLDGQPRGVWVRALSADQRCKAAALAHRWALRELGPPPAQAQMRDAYLLGYEVLVDRRTVVEEAALMVVEPDGLTAEALGRWGDAVIQNIHMAGLRLEDFPADLIAHELARLNGGPPPSAPGTVADEPQPIVAELAPDPE